MGMTRIRFARWGRKNLPFYRITVADSRSPRDGKFLEILGHYNPLPGKDGMKRIGINSERIKYWLSVGAQPTPPVARLFGLLGLVPQAPSLFRTATSRRSGPAAQAAAAPGTGAPDTATPATGAPDTGVPPQ